MTLEREAMIREAWERFRDAAKTRMHFQSNVQQLVISEPQPVGPWPPNPPSEGPVTCDAVFHTAYFVMEWNSARDWRVVCEGLVLECGRFGTL